MKPRLSAATVIGAVAFVQAVIQVALSFGLAVTAAQNAAITAAVAVGGTLLLHLFDPTAPDIPPPTPLVREEPPK